MKLTCEAVAVCDKHVVEKYGVSKRSSKCSSMIKSSNNINIRRVGGGRRYERDDNTQQQQQVFLCT